MPKQVSVAIIGGGPGGLFAAWHLAEKAGSSCQITIYEASERLGGKIFTGQFSGIGPYEAGVAEIYDYSRIGPDPLRDLIVDYLGLKVKYLQGGPCVIDGKIIPTSHDLGREFGKRTQDEVNAFLKRCVDLMSPEDYYLSNARTDNEHCWAEVSAEYVLDTEIKDDVARRYVRASAHSDVAAPPHLTNGLNFLKNVVVDIDGYMDIFSVVGGNEQIVTGLIEELDAETRLGANVVAVEPLPDGTYKIELQTGGAQETVNADLVIVALPLTSLSTIYWRSEPLQRAIDRHIAYYDRPAHYVRATLLFKRPFWREHLPTDWWYLDAFDGSCVYDEGARNDFSGCGALAFLIAGNAALALANLSDDRIERLCLDALPPELAEGKDLIIDRRIHRWMASVNAIPGGLPVRQHADSHRPDAKNLPGLVLVGDYIFDATLNGAFDSADAATDIVMAEILIRRRAELSASDRELASIAETLEQLCPVSIVGGILRTTWGLGRNSKILHVGAGSGQTVAALRALGYDAIGVECNKPAIALTPSEVGDFNLYSEFDNLPFKELAFDAVIESGLCRLPQNRITKAIEEIRRVTRHGLVLGSVATDLPIDLIERHDLLNGVETLGSRWDWSEKLCEAGFSHALMDPVLLNEAWKIAEAAGAGPGHWYEDAESLLHCIYEPKNVGVPKELPSLSARDYVSISAK
ncbi:FAD-dependent oxidoreductase [Hyphomicrobium sp. 99]|uniref:FAD-dependent oxidoreductase n=1 Tax=Hyphomicrobium sp. 99 TaxID=1163419 RepID=UPI00069709BD|nr:FAD-dependent oxidoreductase [Hyphomicrobium sp. 99]